MNFDKVLATAKKHAGKNKKQIDGICSNCLIEFTYLNVGPKRKFCTARCREKFWIKNGSKEKKNIAQLKYRRNHLEACRERGRIRQRRLNNIKRFGGNRLIVLERDNKKCSYCNKDFGRLIIH